MAEGQKLERDDQWKPEIPDKHPSILEPIVLIVGALAGILGAIIGVELITRVGITPNTSIIGAIIAIALSRIPILAFRNLRSVHRQNLMQTVISGATFGAGNALILPMGILWLMGKPELVPAMLLGAIIGMVVDAWILYMVFDSRIFPATGAWPPGIATAETIIAGDVGGKRAWTLVAGGVIGGIGTYSGFPMDIFGVCWIGNIWALFMFGVGLLVRGYAKPLINVDVNAIYLPHGIMIGAGIVALIQIIQLMRGKSKTHQTALETHKATRTQADIKQGFGYGFIAYLAGAIILAIVGGIVSEMSFGQLLLFIVFAAIAAEVSEIMVGLAAMHAGWFPGFATALIFLVLGMLMGFPPLSLAFLVGYTASTGPAFADMGYDLKAGWILRGSGEHPEFEMAGRFQQFWAKMLGAVCAIVFLLIFYKAYFGSNLFPPVDRVFVATIKAGASPEVLKWLL
ncbi:MAG: OPT/YSL family transporter, partial [Spirochaetales bacterium]|nr:OPT/YSL family transporter [Spirochaetales bacterium]